MSILRVHVEVEDPNHELKITAFGKAPTSFFPSGDGAFSLLGTFIGKGVEYSKPGFSGVAYDNANTALEPKIIGISVSKRQFKPSDVSELHRLCLLVEPGVPSITTSRNILVGPHNCAVTLEGLALKDWYGENHSCNASNSKSTSILVDSQAPKLGLSKSVVKSKARNPFYAGGLRLVDDGQLPINSNQTVFTSGLTSTIRTGQQYAGVQWVQRVNTNQNMLGPLS